MGAIRKCTSHQVLIPLLSALVLTLAVVAFSRFQPRCFAEGFAVSVKKPLVQSAYKLIGKTTNPRGRAILHIGPHKVASTYLQAKLCQERDTLEQLGYAIPIADTCKKCRAKHFAGVAFQLKGETNKAGRYSCSSDLPVTELKDFLQSHNSGGAVILSSEEFDDLNEDQVAELANILSDYDTTIVSYYRLKLEHFVSYFTQLQKGRERPISFLDFFWSKISKLNPEAGPADPMTRLNGLCYKRVLESFGRHFGVENLVVINYNGLKAAGLDPWEVMVKEVLGHTEYKLPDDAESKPRNVSPNPLTLSVAAHYFQLVWAQSQTSNSNSSGEIHHPTYYSYDCIRPLLGPLEKVVPKKCSNLKSTCALWELQESEYLTQINGRAKLLHFDFDDEGAVTLGGGHDDYTVCEVDEKSLQDEYKKDSYRAALEEVNRDISDKCSNK